MFNSGEYFNPNYKDVYDVVFTQFHSSVTSAVSSPVNLNYSSEKYIKDSQLQYVREIFKKYFNELSRVNCQYIIIDFL